MANSIEVLERRIDELRREVRKALVEGDRARAASLRAELRTAERGWDEAMASLDNRPDLALESPPSRDGSLLPVREQVHHALTLLSVPASPKLIVAVHEAFFTGEIVGARLTSLRRDEERSFRAAPYARPYYLCPALTADLLAPARGLLAVSTWPLENRIVGPLSPRVHFLTAAIRIAEHIERLPDPRPSARRLLWRFAANVPSGADTFDAMTSAAVADAARAELAVHADADRSQREAAARRARDRLDAVDQLFGARPPAVRATGTDS